MSDITTTHVILLDNGKSVTLEAEGLTFEDIARVRKVLNTREDEVVQRPFRLHRDNSSWSDNACLDGFGHS